MNKQLSLPLSLLKHQQVFLFISILLYLLLISTFLTHLGMVRQILKIKPQQEKRARKVTKQFIKNMLKVKVKPIKKRARLITKSKLSLILNEDMMQCPLCLQLMVMPVVTECGHNYCLPCIEEYFLRASDLRQNPRCSICRSHLEFYDYHQSPSLNTMVKQCVLRLDRKGKKAYKKRLRDAQREAKDRMFRFFQICERIDYFDSNMAQWRNGIIIKIYFNEQAMQVVTIQGYDEDGDPKYYRYVGNSKKIASDRYFTRSQEDQEDQDHQDHQDDQEEQDDEDDQDEQDDQDDQEDNESPDQQ